MLEMKRVFSIVLMLLLLCGSTALGVEKQKLKATMVPGRASAAVDTLDSALHAAPEIEDTLFNSFRDSNSNGVDDRVEDARRKTTKVEAKGATEETLQQPAAPAEKYVPGGEKTKAKAKPAETPKQKPRTKPEPKSKK